MPDNSQEQARGCARARGRADQMSKKLDFVDSSGLNREHNEKPAGIEMNMSEKSKKSAYQIFLKACTRPRGTFWGTRNLGRMWISGIPDFEELGWVSWHHTEKPGRAATCPCQRDQRRHHASYS